MEYTNKQKMEVSGQTKSNKHLPTKNRVVVTKGEGSRKADVTCLRVSTLGG